MTKIISAARSTGKSSYLKELGDSVVVVVPNESYRRMHNYENSITAKMLLEVLDSRGRVEGDSARYYFAFEEPGLYDMTFFKLLHKIPKEQVYIVIGTPMGGMNLFDWYLHANKDKVVIWSNASNSTELDMFGSLAERTGEF